MLESAFKHSKDSLFIATVFEETTKFFSMYYRNSVPFKIHNQEYEGLGSVQDVYNLFFIHLDAPTANFQSFTSSSS
jgi:hypothetical protein